MTEQLKATIEVSIAPRQGAVGAWNVEAIDEDGSIEQAIFAGPNAERRARSYAELQYTRAPVQSDDADYLRKLALGHSPGVARRLERIAARLTRPSPEADALREIAAERQRQISAEGWTLDHDDTHDKGEMAVAAACYADPKPARFSDPRITTPIRWAQALSDWDWNPKDRRSNLIRAGALIVAEIERLDRAALARTPAQEGE